jgi:hypothetical protein
VHVFQLLFSWNFESESLKTLQANILKLSSEVDDACLQIPFEGFSLGTLILQPHKSNLNLDTISLGRKLDSILDQVEHNTLVYIPVWVQLMTRQI